MSYHDFKQALELAVNRKYFISGTGLTAEEMKKAEKILGLTFSPQLVEYYKKFNYISFYGCEIFGIDLDNLDIFEGNTLTYALCERKEFGLPQEWLPIYNFEDGSLAFLDFGCLNNEKEPAVIRCLYNGERYQKIEDISEDFGSFLLSLVLENY
ncbi:MAG: SMI1/KNR4 family protein [Erysipelotrichia bacterium]|nr:SMI1/KNR4 family protein [Erysipelotrichia bacterium]